MDEGGFNFFDFPPPTPGLSAPTAPSLPALRVGGRVAVVQAGAMRLDWWAVHAGNNRLEEVIRTAANL